MVLVLVLVLGRGGSGLTPTWIPLLSSICFFLLSALKESSGSKESEARLGVLAQLVKVLSPGGARAAALYVSRGTCSSPGPSFSPRP